MIADRHAQMGGWLAGRWNMPTSLSDPIIRHDDPEWAEEGTPVAIVYAANRLAHRYGFGCDVDDTDLLADPILAEIGVDAARLAWLDATAPALYESARHVVGVSAARPRSRCRSLPALPPDLHPGADLKSRRLTYSVMGI